MGRVATAALDRPQALSPIERITRGVKPAVQLVLYGRSAGHCQFEGCPNDVTEHHVSKTPGNYGDKAHVVAFRKQGPRGETIDRPEDINSIENLMLLCPTCHRHVDRHPLEFPRDRLEAMKRAHEDHVRTAMTQRPAMRTHVVVVQIPIGTKPVLIADQHVREAILPRYPGSSIWNRIDLNGIAAQGETDAFYGAAVHQIDEEVRALCRPDGPLRDIAHASVFALGPIPLLVEFGARLTDKISCDFFQKHQDTEDWAWKTDGNPVRYEFSLLRAAPVGAPVVLCLALSGTIDPNDLPEEFGGEAAVYELRPAGRVPSRSFLNTRADLGNFRLAYVDALGSIAEDHGVGSAINIIPAIPAPVAVMCGRARHPKAQGPLRVYDLLRDRRGYVFRLEIRHDKA